MLSCAMKTRLTLLGLLCATLVLWVDAAAVNSVEKREIEKRTRKEIERRGWKAKRAVGDDSETPFALRGNLVVNSPATFTNAKCLPWYPIRDAIMGEIFGGVCGDAARATIRLVFHDAGTYSRSAAAQGIKQGGADGSILTSATEVLRSENNGLQAIVDVLRPLAARFNVSNADIVHVAGTLAVVNCPGGPAINTYIGRLDPPEGFEAPDGLLPSPTDSADSLIARFADLGFLPSDLSALVGAHSTAKQRFVEVDVTGETLDATVDIWDTRFYSEIVNFTKSGYNAADYPGVFRLQSDVTIAKDPRSGLEFNRFVTDQDDWLTDYAEAHEPLSLLGQNAAVMTQCNELLPPRIDITQLLVNGTELPPGTFGGIDGDVDPDKLSAAIKTQRGPWLNASAVGIKLPVIPDPASLAKRSGKAKLKYH